MPPLLPNSSSPSVLWEGNEKDCPGLPLGLGEPLPPKGGLSWKGSRYLLLVVVVICYIIYRRPLWTIKVVGEGLGYMYYIFARVGLSHPIIYR